MAFPCRSVFAAAALAAALGAAATAAAGPPAVSPVAAAASPSGELADRIAAAVDEVAIPESEVRRAMVVSALSPEPGETAEAFRARVLDALIDQKLQYREALRFGPGTPEPALVDAAWKRLQDRLRTAGRDPDAEFAAASMTPAEVREALERQIVVQNYLQERFRPIAVAVEDRAHEEYDKYYVPERRAAGASPAPFEAVADEMRRASQQRIFDEEAAKWMKEIRQKAQIAVYSLDAPLLDGTPVPLPAERRLPPAHPSKAPGFASPN